MTKNAKKRTCFVISPIGKEGGPTRKRSDKLLKYVIREVLEDRYQIDRADQIAEPGIITNQIVDKIVECDVLIADLTEGNPNVFYELAIRHGLKKPFIHIIDAAEKIPFDNAQVRTIQVDLTDLDSVAKAKSELAAQIASIESGQTNAESPISVAFDLETLRKSGDSDETMLAAIYNEMTALRGEVRTIKRQSRSRFMSSDGPNSAEELYAQLTNSGNRELAERFARASVNVFEKGNISLTTAESSDFDRQLERDLSDYLNRNSMRMWNVDVLPF